MRAEIKSPVVSVISAPFARLADLPEWGKVWTLVVVVGELVHGDTFATLFLIFLVSSWGDWVVGKRAARAREEYRPEMATIGLYSKGAGVLLVLLVWAIAMWASVNLTVPDQVIGVAPVAVTFAFIVQDLESIDEHRQTLGSRPIPLLSWVLRWLRELPEKLMPPERTP